MKQVYASLLQIVPYQVQKVAERKTGELPTHSTGVLSKNHITNNSKLGCTKTTKWLLSEILVETEEQNYCSTNSAYLSSSTHGSLYYANFLNKQGTVKLASANAETAQRILNRESNSPFPELYWLILIRQNALEQ